MATYILLCDDEISILRAAEFKLKRAGYEVRTAGDGEEGWEAIQSCMPDLLITDCQMPRLDGLELVRRLRSCPKTADLPVLMLTAKGFELSHQELYRELGILRVIAKPFSPHRLLDQVNDVLNGIQGSKAESPRSEVEI
jgi:two-component system, OmpR family, alkaline phosphatase synthesis response regulator PhoP